MNFICAALELFKLLLLILFYSLLLVKSLRSFRGYSLELCFHSRDELQQFFFQISVNFIHSLHTVVLRYRLLVLATYHSGLPSFRRVFR